MESVDICHLITSDDGTLTEEHALYKWNELRIKAAELGGRSLTEAKNNRQRLIRSGFVNVEERLAKWPINPWPKDKIAKEVGLCNLESVGNGLEALTMAAFTRVLGWEREEVHAFLPQVRKDIRNPNIHAYCPMCVYQTAIKVAKRSFTD